MDNLPLRLHIRRSIATALLSLPLIGRIRPIYCWIAVFGLRVRFEIEAYYDSKDPA